MNTGILFVVLSSMRPLVSTVYLDLNKGRDVYLLIFRWISKRCDGSLKIKHFRLYDEGKKEFFFFFLGN